MKSKYKKIYITTLSLIAITGTAHAGCHLDNVVEGWTSAITFHCDSKTDLTKNPISFTLSNGVTARSAWSSNGSVNGSISVGKSGNKTVFQIGQMWWPKDDYVLSANDKAVINFSPSSDQFKLTDFQVGSVPKTQASIKFIQDAKSDNIPDNAVITLTAISNNQAGYQFNWKDVKSGNLSEIKAGQYQISAVYDGQVIETVPAELMAQTGKSYTITLDYKKYAGQLAFSTSFQRPANAGDIAIKIDDKHTGQTNQLSLPWSEQTAILKNIRPNHQYTFSAADIFAGHNRYQFSFDPESITTTAQKSNYNIVLQVKSMPVVSYQVDFTISGLPGDAQSSITLTNSDKGIHITKVVRNGDIRLKLPAGNYQLSAQTLMKDGYQYQYNNGDAKTITVGKDQDKVAITFSKHKIGGLVPGWPSYLSMGAVTDGTNTFSKDKVDAIFKYAGSGGNGDPGVITMPIFTQETVDVAKNAGKENQHPIVPVIVVYTLQMSGGTAYGDLSDKDNVLTKHFVNLMLYAQVLQNAKDKDGITGSIVLNPDLLGMIQQQHLYNADTKELGNMTEVKVNQALQKAYWFVNQAHNWTFTPNSGSAFTVEGKTPLQVFEAAESGAYKKHNIYSAWDLKRAWEGDNRSELKGEADKILETAPSDLHADIPTFTDNFNGWVQATNWAIHNTGPSIPFGWQENVWNITSANWVHSRETTTEIESKITDPTYKLIDQLGIYSGQYQPNFLVFDKYERNANAALGSGYLWNGQDWNNYITYVSQLSKKFNNIPVMLWQIPGGHLQTNTETDNTTNTFSTAPDYFFGDKSVGKSLGDVKDFILNTPLTGGGIYPCKRGSCTVGQYLNEGSYNWQKSMLQNAASGNVFAILWGGGSTTSVSSFPDKTVNSTWLAAKVNAYEQAPVYLNKSSD
ncbi:hypothetical protein [Facilibium subflavum]|uniref:hypothetical protein n=1 Tax=Facilibium subflavum TaxID=2219058 RepID=UPI000E6576B9|nr:hypothetical protein [Facilibium subflavum]